MWLASCSYCSLMFVMFYLRFSDVGTHLEVFPSKELDPHDGEDEPEDEADEQDVEDAWDCLDESVDHNLRLEHP